MGKDASGRRGRRAPLAAVAGLLMLLSGCGHQPGPAASTCAGDEFYFPPATFPTAYPGSDLLRRRWYSSSLQRLGEPSLSCGAGAAETYRFIWLHQFAQPVVIRVSRRGSRIEADAFQLSGEGGADPGWLSYQAHRQLSATDWTALQARLRDAHFWSLPTSGNLYAAHGEQWILEGRRDGSYHVVDRWTPAAGAYRELGVWFFDAVGWERPHSSRY
jgi:hypothetical protein